MNLLEQLKNTNSVTSTLEKFYNEKLQYSPIINDPEYQLTPNEMIVLNSFGDKVYKRYGFLTGIKSGQVYAKVESVTLDRYLKIDMRNNIPLGKLLEPLGFTRKNVYAKRVFEFDEAGNPIDFKITAILYVKSIAVAMVKESIYSPEGKYIEQNLSKKQR